MKNSLRLMAIVAALGMVFMAAPVLATETDTTTSTGDVPWVYDWTLVSGGANFADVTYASFDAANGLEKTDLVVVTMVDSNSYFKISAKRGDWTLPGSYHATGGKAGSDADVDFRILVNNVALGSGGAQDFAIKNSFNAYKAITSVDQIIIGGIDEDQSYQAAGFDIDGSVLFDYDYDIKGTYGLTLTLTIANATQ